MLVGYHSSWGPAREFHNRSDFDCNEFLVNDARQAYPEFCIFYQDNPLVLIIEKEIELSEKTYLPTPSQWKKTYPQETEWAKHLVNYYSLVAMGQLAEQTSYLNQLFILIETALPVETSHFPIAFKELKDQLEVEKQFLQTVLREEKRATNLSPTLLMQDQYDLTKERYCKNMVVLLLIQFYFSACR